METLSRERSQDLTPAEPHAPKRKWIGLAGLAVGLGMIVLDGTIVGVALPTIIADLRLTLTDAQWVNSLYSVVFAALLLTLGRMADRIGRRTVFITGVLVFVAGSVLAAMATDAGQLIATRAIQGVGGAMVLPASLSTVNATFRGRDRAVAFGVWGAVMAGAAAIGPLLGAWLTSSFSWPWIFLVNVPIGTIVVLTTILAVPNTKAKHDARGFDLGGLVLSAPGFGLVVFGLIEGTNLGWWERGNPLRIGDWTWPWDVSAAPIAIGAGLVLVAAFVAWESWWVRTGRAVILDISLFRIETFSAGNLAATMVAVGEFALVFALPLYLMGVLGATIMDAGWVLAAMAIGALVAGGSARHLAARLGAPRVVVLGIALELVAVTALALLISTDTSPVVVAAALAVYGVGLGMASAQLTSTVLADVPRDRSGSGSATQSTVRQLGSALGSAVAGTVLGSYAGLELQRATAEALTAGTRGAVWAAAGFLVLGLVGAVVLAHRIGRR